MAKAFSVASWNVEHFGKTKKNSETPKKPMGPIIDYLSSQKADIVAVYEVVGKMVFKEIMKKMTGYQFHITEGPQTQEILVGLKKTISCFFTQKTTFKVGASMLRPGAFLTVTKDGVNYPLLSVEFLLHSNVANCAGAGTIEPESIYRVIICDASGRYSPHMRLPVELPGGS